MRNKKSPEEIAQMRRQDYITNKLLLVFTVAFVFIMYVMSLDNSKSTFEGFFALEGKIALGLGISGGIFVAGIVWMLVEKFVTKRDTEYKLFTGKHIAVVGLFATVCMYDLFSRVMNDPDAFARIYVFIPVVVALYIIYSSYQREFFMISLASAFGGIAVWNVIDYVYGDPKTFTVAAIVAVAVICAVTVWAQMGKGKVSLFGRNFEIFKSDARYALMYLSYILIAALMLAVFAIDLAMYFVFGLIGYVVLVGIYYTVKLI